MCTRIKNCGLTTPEAILQSATTGASFVGFVHHEPSPRHLGAAQIAALFAHVPRSVARVIVLVDPGDALLATLPRPEYWQIHNVTDPARIAAIHASTGIPVITAMQVRSRADLAPAAALESASAHLLFDAPAAGSGAAFDWALLRGLNLQKPWFLAGGLTASNVAAAIRVTGAPMVDVSSGIESARGIKSLEMIAAFNAAVLDTSHA